MVKKAQNLKMPQDTQTLLQKALTIGDQIVSVVKRFTHSRSICDKLCNKVNGSQKVVKELSLKYESNRDYFEQTSYNSAFNNYVNVMENCLHFLEAIEHKALFVRLINGDKYKKTFYRIFIDIDQAVSVLNLGLSVKSQLNMAVSLEDLNTSQKNMAMIADRGGFEDILADGEQREHIMEDIKNVQEDKDESADILASVEIPQRQIKTIPGLLPRQGRRYTVYKRLYQGKVIAEKTLKESMSDDKMLSDMRKQVAILKRLAVCPYIIKFTGVCIKGSKIGLITEYAEKGNLKDLLESTQKVDMDLKYQFMVDVVEGLAFLHEMKVLHKNIKTSSILITDSFKAKISGFEFSREMSAGTVLNVDDGSDRYRWIPPEKIQDYFEYTTKSDIYSLGMVLWSIWSRRYPYEIMSQQAIEDLVSRGGREDITQVPKDMSPIILGCWQQDPMERPDASDIINELDSMSNVAGESEVIPEAMQDLWSDKKVWMAGEAFGVDLIFEDVNKRFENISIANSSHQQGRNSFGNNNYVSRPSSFGSLENVLAPSAPMMPAILPEPTAPSAHYQSPTPYIPPTSYTSSNIQMPKMSLPQEPSRFNPPEVARPSPPASSGSRSLGETQLFNHDQEDFDEHLFDPPRQNFNETRLDFHDQEEQEDLDIFLRPEPQYTLDQAMEFHNTNRRLEAFEAFKHLSEREEPKAFYYLGYYYFWGQEGVVDKEWSLALTYFLKAAEHDDSDAFDHLGMFYSNEQNPQRNLVKAFEYYQKAANLDNKKGFYHLGICYAKGRGCKINRELALFNITEAANRGHSLAIEQLNRSRNR